MNNKYDHEHFDEFYYCPICMQYQYPKSDVINPSHQYSGCGSAMNAVKLPLHYNQTIQVGANVGIWMRAQAIKAVYTTCETYLKSDHTSKQNRRTKG